MVGFWDKGNKGTIEAGREGPSPKKVLDSKDEIYFEFLEKKKRYAIRTRGLIGMHGLEGAVNFLLSWDRAYIFTFIRGEETRERFSKV